MLVGMEGQTVLQFNKEQVAITQTLSVTMLLMHSMSTIIRIRLLLAVISEEQHNLPTQTQVRRVRQKGTINC